MSGVAQLCHHDDGKEKWQSHEVYLKYPMFYEGIRFEYKGYGATYEEAHQEFLEKYKNALKNFEAFTKMLLETDALEVLEVDCMGNVIYRLGNSHSGKALTLEELRTKVLYTIFVEIGKASRSGTVNGSRLQLMRISGDKFYFNTLPEPLLAEEYGKTWQAYISTGRIYK